MTLTELNAKDRRAFVEAVGWVFEDSPWVAERVWDNRPFASLDALHEAMTGIVASATYEEQIALLRAHPDLGTVRLKADPTEDVLKADPTEDVPEGAPEGAHHVGRVRLQADRLSEASQREQTGARLDTLTRDERDRLTALNTSYREKFGFPFLYAVKGSTKHDVLSALERRLPSTRDIEHQEALRQVSRIARFRLEDAVGQP